MDEESQPAPLSLQETGAPKREEMGLEEVALHLWASFLSQFDHDLKGYFEHLQTRTFFKRCVRSLVPAMNYDEILAQPDLYGAVCLTFILSSIMHFDFKSVD